MGEWDERMNWGRKEGKQGWSQMHLVKDIRKVNFQMASYQSIVHYYLYIFITLSTVKDNFDRWLM